MRSIASEYGIKEIYIHKSEVLSQVFGPLKYIPASIEDSTSFSSPFLTGSRQSILSRQASECSSI